MLKGQMHFCSVTALHTVKRRAPSFNAVLINSENVGQPSFTIPYSQLHFLITKNQFTTPQITKIMGTLIQTIQRKMSE